MTICGLCGKPVSEGKNDPTEIVLCKTCGDMLKGNFVFVVRCKDCKHGDLCKEETGKDIVECFKFNNQKHPEFFCACGERK